MAVRSKSSKDNQESFMDILNMLEEEKGISKQSILNAIKDALKNAYKKNYTRDQHEPRRNSDSSDGEKNTDNIDVVIEDNGDVHIFAAKTIVDHSSDPTRELSMEEAARLLDDAETSTEEIEKSREERKKQILDHPLRGKAKQAMEKRVALEDITLTENANIIDSLKDAKVGDVVKLETTPKDFCRVAAQQARNVMLQEIKNAEKHRVVEEYLQKVHTVVVATVQRIENKVWTDREGVEHTSRRVILSLDDHTEVPLADKQSVPSEHFNIGDRVKVYISSVREPEPGQKGGPRIIVSRNDPELVRKLMEDEVTEIRDGIVEIKRVARDPGSRSKVSVWSNDPGVDALGSCVGPNGSRINALVTDLRGEKIDVINWDPDPVVLIGNALSPSKVVSVRVCLADKSARVVVPDYQLSLAIGRKGQNASLAAHLTGYKIDIKSESQQAELDEQGENLEEDGKIYIGRGEYLNFNEDGTPKPETPSVLSQALREMEADEAGGNPEFVEINPDEVVELSDEDEADLEEIDIDDLKDVDLEDLEDIDDSDE